jgi:hypothetical protein
VFSTFPTRKSQRETGFFRRRDSTHFYFYEQEHFFLSTRVGWSFRLEFLRILKRAYRRRTNSPLNLNRIAATSLRAKRSAAHWPKKTDEKLKFNRCDWTSTFTAKLFPSSLRDKSNFSLFIISNKMSSVLKRQRERERERESDWFSFHGCSWQQEAAQPLALNSLRQVREHTHTSSSR